MQILKSKDNAEGQFDAGITASDLSITLKSGQGVLFPEAIKGTATSVGSGLILNSTGIGSKNIAVGDVIENVNDGSLAVVKTKTTDQITTTQLIGGADNTWQSGDIYAVNRFIVTATKRSESGGIVTITAQEQILVDERNAGSDILTINASGRGYNSSGAKSFSGDDYVSIFVSASYIEKVKELVAQYIASNDVKIDEKADTVDLNTDVASLQSQINSLLANLESLPTTIASQAEAEAGNENTKIMTAFRTKQAIAALASQIQSPTTKSRDTVYQATTNGFLFIALSGGVSARCQLTVKTDGNNPPTTVIAVVYKSDGNGLFHANFSYPIKKGDYYKVETTEDLGNTYATKVVKFIPMS